jgi:hypothetical protein
MLDELVALVVGRTVSFFFWRDDVVDVFVEPGIEGIAEFAVQHLLAFFAVFGAEGLSGEDRPLQGQEAKAKEEQEVRVRRRRPLQTDGNSLSWHKNQRYIEEIKSAPAAVSAIKGSGKLADRAQIYTN